MDSLTERLALTTASPPPISKDLLAHFHSGDLLRRSLPKVLRIGAGVWFLFVVLAWLATWPILYEQLERWNLVKAFFAQVLWIGTAFLVFRISMLRAEHLATLPPDDFVILRSLAVLFRWFGEITLVYIVGMTLCGFLQPVNAFLSQSLENVSPVTAAQLSSDISSLLLVSTPVSFLLVAVAAILFLMLYAVATAIDLSLAIEFNTRAERMIGKRVS